jgi:hypothetical protein
MVDDRGIISYEDATDEDKEKQAIFEGSSIHEIIGKMMKFVDKYVYKSDFLSVRSNRPEYFSEVGFSYDFTFLVPRNQKVGAEILIDLVQGDWVTIDPRTKTHCVANCLAIFLLWKGKKQFASCHGWINETGKEIASKHNINQGASVLETRALAKEFQIDVIESTYIGEPPSRDTPFLLIIENHCVICLPKGERS